jgi:two-component system nitrate/nitrite response regulator NarL
VDSEALVAWSAAGGTAAEGSPAPAWSRADLSPLRVLVVDDHALFAESLVLAVRRDGYRVARADLGRPPVRSRILEQVRQRRPAVVLLDLALGDLGDGMPLISDITAAGSAVVVVTACADPAAWGACLHEGASTVLPKTRPLEEVLTVLHRLDSGLPVLAAPGRRELLAVWRDRQRERRDRLALLSRLTRRESQVLGQLSLGRTVRDIATRSMVSEATVRTQVKSILGKLEVSSQVAAVGLAHGAGWVPPVE